MDAPVHGELVVFHKEQVLTSVVGWGDGALILVSMKGLLVLLIHLVAVLARLGGPGGVRG